VEVARTLAARQPGLEVPSLALGGSALCLLALAAPPPRLARLGLGASALGPRLLGGLALAAALLLPAAVRWTGAEPLAGPAALAAVAVSVGEEVAFRGVLFAALEEAGGPLLAVLGSSLAWTAAHALSHPPAFLLPVLAAGLLLGTWRWACRDLVGPVLAHALADLAL
jgi:membrane protease YdiL (CAAX protease family)